MNNKHSLWVEPKKQGASLDVLKNPSISHMRRRYTDKIIELHCAAQLYFTLNAIFSFVQQTVLTSRPPR